MRLGILTSPDIRHRYFVNALRERFAVVAVGYESTGYSPAIVDSTDLSEGERLTVAEHFAERERQEQWFFGAACKLLVDGSACRARQIGPGSLNSSQTLQFLEDAGVDTVTVFGTNLIKPPLLDRWPGRILNMHLGLSPYYRGTATNFYPLLNEEPEYVGATIHLIDAGIDSGPIIRHARPKIESEDGPHTIGCKAIRAGTEAMIRSLEDLERGRLQAVPQWKVATARVYLRKDYHPRQVVELYRKLEAGLIPKYVARAAIVAPRVRVID